MQICSNYQLQQRNLLVYTFEVVWIISRMPKTGKKNVQMKILRHWCISQYLKHHYKASFFCRMKIFLTFRFVFWEWFSFSSIKLKYILVHFGGEKKILVCTFPTRKQSSPDNCTDTAGRCMSTLLPFVTLWNRPLTRPGTWREYTSCNLISPFAAPWRSSRLGRSASSFS